ncbi:hypothetical protein [Streptomyces asiaticus]|uniref:hypothetical protein n=1 Tax=Streptomyces asiaticus TaxID=114695 RepID=UPI003F6629EE
MPADVTALNGSPQNAADQGAVLFSALTGTPYGEPPVAADAAGVLSRADRLRADLRDAARSHLDAITVAAARVSVDYTQNPHFQTLSARVTEMATAVTDAHGSRQMAANLMAVQQAVNGWGGALPADPALDERQHLAWPLAHLLYDTTRLHGRLQATLDAVQGERAAAREQEAAAAAAVSAEPVPDGSTPQVPVPEPAPERAAVPAAEPPAPHPDAPEDPEMATPARPVTPEGEKIDTAAAETEIQPDGRPGDAGQPDSAPVDGDRAVPPVGELPL